MTVRVRVKPALLMWAVEHAGWSEATAAQRAPLLDDRINDSVRPALKQLENFAHATHTPHVRNTEKRPSPPGPETFHSSLNA